MHLGGVVFSIAEDAYAVLSEYLEAIRTHFTLAEDMGDVVEDIELSIAEKLSDAQNANSVVSLAQVEAVMAELGTVVDFEKEMADFRASDASDDTSEDTARSRSPKRLYRNTDERIIGGVASGIAAYFGIDPVFVRALFIILVFVNGIGVLSYLILWLIMPAARTLAQKFQMQGEPVTLHQFQKMVQKNASPHSERSEQSEPSPIVRALRVPFEVVRQGVSFVVRALASLGPVLRVAAGVLLFAVGAVAVFAFTVALTGVHFGVNAGLFELPIRELTTGAEYALGLAAAYALVLIPGIVAVMLGYSVITRAHRLGSGVLGVLAVVWIGALFSVGHVASGVVPQYQAYLVALPTATHTHELAPFSHVRVDTGDTVTIKQGDTHAIELSGKEASVAERSFEVRNGTLLVTDTDEQRVCIGCFRESVSVVITTPELAGVEASHHTEVAVEGFVTDTFTVELAHSAHATLDITASQAQLSLSRGSRASVSGAVDELTADIRQSSRLDTLHLANTHTAVTLAHASHARIGETDTLSVVAAHNSTVRYRGETELTEDVRSAASVRREF